MEPIKPFDYSTSGLPENKRFQVAVGLCYDWLNENMSMFGPERIANFMHNQPIAAAKRIMDNCSDWSEESVTLALLGPAKGELLANPQVEKVARHIFGDRTVDLLSAMVDPSAKPDAEMTRDMHRIFIVEGISTMNDQMVNRKRIDAHHQTRKNILADLETNFAKVKGENPGLDTVFEDAAVKSHAALDALDKAAAAQPKNPNKPPRPPFHGHGM
jgi:hypothetical protein